MSWQILLSISIVIISFSTILQKIIMRHEKSDPIAYAIFFQLFTGVIFIIFTIMHGFHLPNLVPLGGVILLMTFFYGVGNTLTFRAVKLTEASEFTILFSTRAFWGIFAAVIFLHEIFGLSQVIGTILIFLSVTIVSFKRTNFQYNKGGIYALLAGLCFGFGFATDAYLLRYFDVFSYLVVNYFFSGFGTILLYPKSLKKMKSLLLPGILLKLCLLCLMDAIAMICISTALQSGKNIAQISALGQIVTVFTVILSIVILKETSHLWKKVFGALLAFIGVILIG